MVQNTTVSRKQKCFHETLKTNVKEKFIKHIRGVFYFKVRKQLSEDWG